MGFVGCLKRCTYDEMSITPSSHTPTFPLRLFVALVVEHTVSEKIRIVIAAETHKLRDPVPEHDAGRLHIRGSRDPRLK